MNSRQRRAMYAKQKVRRAKTPLFAKEFNQAKHMGRMDMSHAYAPTVAVRRYNAKIVKHNQGLWDAGITPDETKQLTKMKRKARWTLGLVGGKTARTVHIYNRRADLTNQFISKMQTKAVRRATYGPIRRVS